MKNKLLILFLLIVMGDSCFAQSFHIESVGSWRRFRGRVSRIKVLCGYMWVYDSKNGAGVTFQPDGSCK
jgi:hypothetical protein